MGYSVDGNGFIYLKDGIDAKEASSAIYKSADKYGIELTEVIPDEENRCIEVEIYDSHWRWEGVDDFFAEIVPLAKEGNIDFEGDGAFNSHDIWRYHFYPEQNQWKQETPEIVYNSKEYLQALLRNNPSEFSQILSDLGYTLVPREKDFLHVAARNGSIENIRFYGQLGYDLHQNDDMILYVAAEHGQLELVQYLVEDCEFGKFDLNININLAARYAAFSGATDVLSYLFEHGAALLEFDEYDLEHIRESHPDTADYIEEMFQEQEQEPEK